VTADEIGVGAIRCSMPQRLPRSCEDSRDGGYLRSQTCFRKGRAGNSAMTNAGQSNIRLLRHAATDAAGRGVQLDFDGGRQ
jgi:hypothetical protein